MRFSTRSSRHVPAFALLVALLAGCNGDSPTAPQMQAINVSGTWSGPLTFTGVGGGGCAGQALQAGLPFTFTATAALQQSGSTISGSLMLEETGETVAVSGTIQGNLIEVSLVLGGCLDVEAPCLDGRFVTLCIQSGSFSGTINGNQITGQYMETYSSSMGSPMVLRGTITLTR